MFSFRLSGSSSMHYWAHYDTCCSESVLSLLVGILVDGFEDIIDVPLSEAPLGEGWLQTMTGFLPELRKIMIKGVIIMGQTSGAA